MSLESHGVDCRCAAAGWQEKDFESLNESHAKLVEQLRVAHEQKEAQAHEAEERLNEALAKKEAEMKDAIAKAEMEAKEAEARLAEQEMTEARRRDTARRDVETARGLAEQQSALRENERLRYEANLASETDAKAKAEEALQVRAPRRRNERDSPSHAQH